MDYPPTYDTAATNYHDSSAADRPPIGPVMSYAKSIPGILRIAELVISMIAFICSAVYVFWTPFGGGWAQFVSMSAFVIVLALFLITFLNVKPRIPIPWAIIELVFFAVYTLFFVIAGIVAAVRSHWHSSIVAAMVFLFAATGLFVADTFLLYRNWVASRNASRDNLEHTTVTTTTTTYSEQY